MNREAGPKPAGGRVVQGAVITVPSSALASWEPVSEGVRGKEADDEGDARAGGAPPRVVRLMVPPRAPRPMRMAGLTDRELVDRARDRDGPGRGDDASSAFAELVRRHQHRIRRLAFHMMRDQGDAEDVAQEAFVRAYRALDRFDGRSEPYTWLYRIAVNLCLNRLRARRTTRVHVVDDEALVAAGEDDAHDPADDAARRQLYAALAVAIDTLSETLRTTLVLVCIEGVSHEDAARILGAPEGTIAWRVHEARRKLKAMMLARGFDVDVDGDGNKGAT